MKKLTNDQIYLSKYLKLKEEEAKHLVLQEDATKAVDLAEKFRRSIVGICILALCLHLIIPLLGPVYSLIHMLFLSSIIILGPTQMILESKGEKKQKIADESKHLVEQYEKELNISRKEAQYLLPLPSPTINNNIYQSISYNKNKQNKIKLK